MPCKCIVAAALATTLAVTIPVTMALAQSEQPAGSESQQTITVEVPQAREVDRYHTGRLGELYTARAVVYVGDLNLSTGEGRDEMKGRIRTAARSACNEIGDAHPLDFPDAPDPRCVNSAVERAHPISPTEVALAP